MNETGVRAPRKWRLVAGLGLGCATGAAILVVGGLTAAGKAHGLREAEATGIRDVLHTPPLLVSPEREVTLRYEVVCQADELGTPCPIRGTLFVRRFGDEVYRPVPLRAGGESTLAATLAASLVDRSDGFDYYARIDDGLGSSRNIPDGGGSAPQRAWFMRDATRVDLGAHSFGQLRDPDATVLRASWGDNPGAAGLIAGKELARIGPSAFDVTPAGAVVLLDQVNRRLAFYSRPAGLPRYVSIPFAGGEGDLAVDRSGEIHVLDLGPAPVVRSFSSSGEQVASVEVSEAPDMVRAGSDGPAIHGFPGDLWLPLRRGGQPLSPAARAAGARPGLSVGSGNDLVVHGGSNEADFALVAGHRVVHAWRIVSGTNLGEIQLAEPLGGDLVVVLRVWTESSSEFVALVLSDRGLEHSFSMETAEWAEAAALSRFRVHDATLYQLRSKSTGVEIGTFSLGGAN
jgi:hypothetical protein